MFERDQKTKAILNTDDSYYKSVVAMRKTKKREDQLRSELENLQGKYDRLEALVLQLMDKDK